MIAYFASDLLWATRIKSLADDLGIAARPVRTLEMLEARLADSLVRGLIVDLDSPDIALTMIRRIRAAAIPARIIAFGPHVETAALDGAREAGADLVLTRGAFSARLPEVLREFDASA